MRLSRLQKAVLIQSCVSSGFAPAAYAKLSVCKKAESSVTRHPFFRLQKKVAC
ncbi:hypothetical protein B4096_0077 [Heyndrickxia coagulans]|nr:hypothetical protein B4096_0077 [Heyndrickxia coagulans]